MKRDTVRSRLCRLLSHLFTKLVNFVTMRRLLTRVINRVLLGERFSPVMGADAEIHTEGRRKLVSVSSVKLYNQLLFISIDNMFTKLQIILLCWWIFTPNTTEKSDIFVVCSK